MNADMFLDWLDGVRSLTREQRRDVLKMLATSECKDASILVVSEASAVADEPAAMVVSQVLDAYDLV